MVTRILLVSLLSIALLYCSGPATYDLVLRNGTLVDSSGGTSFQGDIAINGVDTVLPFGDAHRDW